MGADPLLTVEHLTTVFETPRGPVAAVDDVGFEIRTGETLGLVGESGCGKSVIALACRPALVIADEPTTALDVTIQAQILDLLREMQSAFNLSLLLITHDLGIVAEMADRVAVMYAGRIVESGPVRAIFRNPAHPYTRGLLASIPGNAGPREAGAATAPVVRRAVDAVEGRRLRAIDGSVPMLGDLPRGCAFNPRCPDRFDPCTVDRPGDYRAGPDQTAKCYLHDPGARRRDGEEPRQASGADAAR